MTRTYSFDLCWQLPWIPELSSFNWFGSKNEQFSQFAHIFHRDQTCLASLTSPTLKLSYLLYLSCPNQSTWWLCRRHTRSTTLVDKIRAKCEQLDSGEFGSPGTPAFDAEACELAHLLPRVSKLCQKLNLPPPKELYRPTFFKHWRHFLDGNSVQAGSLLGCGGCSFVVDM